MFAVRPAMLLLALGLLSLPPAAPARPTGAEPTGGTPRLSRSCPVDSPAAETARPGVTAVWLGCPGQSLRAPVLGRTWRTHPRQTIPARPASGVTGPRPRHRNQATTSPAPTPAEFDNPADLSPRVFRRMHVKADIEEEESDRKVAETDFGPVSAASGFHPHTSINPSRPMFPRTCRLRC